MAIEADPGSRKMLRWLMYRLLNQPQNFLFRISDCRATRQIWYARCKGCRALFYDNGVLYSHYLTSVWLRSLFRARLDAIVIRQLLTVPLYQKKAIWAIWYVCNFTYDLKPEFLIEIWGLERQCVYLCSDTASRLCFTLRSKH